PAAVGSILIAAGIYALIRVRSADSWFFAALAVFGLLSRSGWAPLANAMQKLPLFDLTLNERFSFAGALALVILAALGIERALRNGDRAFGWTLAAATFAYVFGALLIQHLDLVYDDLPEWGVYAFFGEVAGLGVAAILAMLWPRSIAPLLLVALIAQRLISAGDIYPTLPRAAAYP